MKTLGEKTDRTVQALFDEISFTEDALNCIREELSSEPFAGPIAVANSLIRVHEARLALEQVLQRLQLDL